MAGSSGRQDMGKRPRPQTSSSSSSSRGTQQTTGSARRSLTDADRSWLRQEIDQSIRRHEERLTTKIEERLTTKIKGWIKEAIDAFRCSSSRTEPVVDPRRRSRTPQLPDPPLSRPQSPHRSPPPSAFHEFGPGTSSQFPSSAPFEEARHSMPELSRQQTREAEEMVSELFGQVL